MKYSSYTRKDGVYFITLPVYNWLKVFFLPQYANIVLDSLTWLRDKKFMKLYAFVLMPNHLHYIIEDLPNHTINEIVQKLDSFTGHKILELVRQENKIELIDNLKQNATKDKDRKHRIWNDPLDKYVLNERMLWQKVEYIHNNPCQKGWYLVDGRADYKYSSACFYDRDEKPIIDIDDVRELF